MKTYIVGITWTMGGSYKIQAETTQDAIQQALQRSDFPSNAEYLFDSVEVQDVFENPDDQGNQD